MSLPADDHVHSEWSWDAELGSMERTCQEALRVGLRSVAFTEHLDHTVWSIGPAGLALFPPGDPMFSFVDAHGQVRPPALDTAGYLESVERCRARFPDLRIHTGLEVGEPHWHADAVAEVLATGDFERVLGSLHCLLEGGILADLGDLFAARDPRQVYVDYLAELTRLVTASDAFSVVAHIDYPIRYWPVTARPFDPARCEEELRSTLRVIAATGRALEINTVIPLHRTILQWWYDERGEAVTFGSDAHEPADVGRGFAEAAAVAREVGFRPGSDPWEAWPRV